MHFRYSEESGSLTTVHVGKLSGIGNQRTRDVCDLVLSSHRSLTTVGFHIRYLIVAKAQLEKSFINCPAEDVDDHQQCKFKLLMVV